VPSTSSEIVFITNTIEVVKFSDESVRCVAKTWPATRTALDRYLRLRRVAKSEVFDVFTCASLNVNRDVMNRKFETLGASD